MKIDWWTLGLQTANVLVLIWILSRFLFRPVAAMIEERRALATKSLDDAKADRAAAEAERHKAEEATAGLAQARVAALKSAAEEAEAEKQGILASARAEAERLRKAAEADIARARQDDAAAIEGRASTLALDIADKLLSRLPEEARVAGFIDGLVEALAALPAPVRASLGTGGAALPIRSARMPTQSEAKLCTERLSQALGRPLELAWTADPALIAGLELDLPHASVRNSLRADLDRVAAALATSGGPTP
ncbi:ATP synthase F0 subunit B [Ancylobacter pratisalsi]|uniref:ATP synthase subunit b n=1 Tax=Ancylobacter pratisalsi TaxID=1745854 RepID=A0A6P1YRJ9_9HYPH|nr:ATP synthase F0 subunit B [Ancylobacter pratisalsi]QIB35742.1 ATPase [Ancylobacter pratisalsi]